MKDEEGKKKSTLFRVDSDVLLLLVRRTKIGRRR